MEVYKLPALNHCMSGIGPLDVMGAKALRLKVWWEVVGVLRGVRETGGRLEVYIDCGEVYRLSFPRDSAEAEILRRGLRGMEGRVVGILRTDLGDMPIAVRQG
jgi:hypothetical protein